MAGNVSYYRALVRQLPGLLIDAVGRATAGVALVACALAAFGSSRAANAVIAPAWWALVLIGVVFAAAILRANHRVVRGLQHMAATASPARPSTTTTIHVHAPSTFNFASPLPRPPVSETTSTGAESFKVQTTANDPQGELPLGNQEASS